MKILCEFVKILTAWGAQKIVVVLWKCLAEFPGSQRPPRTREVLFGSRRLCFISSCSSQLFLERQKREGRSEEGGMRKGRRSATLYLGSHLSRSGIDSKLCSAVACHPFTHRRTIISPHPPSHAGLSKNLLKYFELWN